MGNYTDQNQNMIIYNTVDGKAKVSLFAKDGNVWMNQSQIAELFDTSIPNISMHISNIIKDGELGEISVIKDYLTTASDGKDRLIYEEFDKRGKTQEANQADEEDLKELEDLKSEKRVLES